MDEKTTAIITTLVSVIGLAVAISKEVREWYKATKKEKRQIPVHRKHRR